MKCADCSTDTASRRLCERCTDRLRSQLVLLAVTWADAHTTMSRQDRVTRSAVRSGEASTPWVMNPDVAALLSRIEIDLRRWHTVLCHAPTLTRTVDDVLMDLHDAAEYIAHRTAAAQLLKWVNRSIVQIALAVDLPPERQWLGYCERCGRDLWAVDDSADVACVCSRGTPVLVDQRRRELVAEMQDKLLTAAEAARLLSMYGERVGESTIHSWAKKQLLTSRGEGPSGRLYLVGDITRLMDEAEKRRRDRRPAKA